MVNNVGGNSHHIANISNQDNMELQQRGAGPASATANVADIGEARRAEIDRIAHQLESYFPGGEEIRDILHQKATVLHDEIGHTADDVIATMAKAEKLDRITSSLEGGANALGYAISGVPGSYRQGARPVFGPAGGYADARFCHWCGWWCYRSRV